VASVAPDVRASFPFSVLFFPPLPRSYVSALSTQTVGPDDAAPDRPWLSFPLLYDSSPARRESSTFRFFVSPVRSGSFTR